MITRKEFLENHWEPYMLRERDFLDLLDYVALRKCNFNTCSERIIRQLFANCELFESLVKSMYELKGKGSIGRYREEMQKDQDLDKDAIIEVQRGVGDMKISPFTNLDLRVAKDPNFDWWKAHTDIKHNYAAEFQRGSLKCALDSLAVLYYMNLLYAKKIGNYLQEANPDLPPEERRDVPNDISKLFSTDSIQTIHMVAAYEFYAVTDEEIHDMWES